MIEGAPCVVVSLARVHAKCSLPSSASLGSSMSTWRHATTSPRVCTSRPSSTTAPNKACADQRTRRGGCDDGGLPPRPASQRGGTTPSRLHDSSVTPDAGRRVKATVALAEWHFDAHAALAVAAGRTALFRAAPLAWVSPSLNAHDRYHCEPRLASRRNRRALSCLGAMTSDKLCA